jgi:hypothetical protein
MIVSPWNGAAMQVIGFAGRNGGVTDSRAW